jgi:cystathionine beta-lyase
MIWLDCRELNLKGDALKDFFIKEAGLGFNDGQVFGTGGEGFMRMNVACPKSTVEAAMGKLKSAIGKL